MMTLPTQRLRRMRSDMFSRMLNEEYRLHADDLLLPVFVHDRPSAKEPISSMPGTFRLGTEECLRKAEECLELGIPGLVLFPVIAKELKDHKGSQALNPEGPIPKIAVLLKEKFPELGLISDVALDPFTSHGHDGLLDEKGYVDNDSSLQILAQQALLLAQAGVDVVAPSDMMDGRVRVIRRTLDENKLINTKIMAYSAKYASAFYGPFRDALGSSSCLRDDKASGSTFFRRRKDFEKLSPKMTYQMDPSNANEALREVALDIEEGADMILVKPGLPYLDIIKSVTETFKVPTFAYQVSGEYSMLKAAAASGFIDEKSAVLETLIAFRRAGCRGIISYYATEVAGWLK